MTHHDGLMPYNETSVSYGFARYLCRILLGMTNMTHHINKYINQSKKDCRKGYIGVFVRHVRHRFLVLPIGKRNNPMTHSVMVRHGVRHGRSAV